MKKVALFVMIFAVISVPAWGADSTAVPGAWQTHLEASLAAAQSSYSDNWGGGQSGSINWVANLHAVANKILTSLVRTENDLKLQFGQTHNQVDSTKVWQIPVKSSDRIRFDTVWKFALRTYVDPYAAGYIETEFYDATVPAHKIALSPLEFSESAGISRDITKTASTKLNTRLGFAFRQKIIKAAVPDPVDPTIYNTTTTRVNDGGLERVTDFTQAMHKNLLYTSKLTVFKALFISNNPLENDPVRKDFWKTPSVNWDNILSANVTKIVQVSLAWQLLYDKPISLAGRFRQTLALGVNWKI
jgi:hypothetical protein